MADGCFIIPHDYPHDATSWPTLLDRSLTYMIYDLRRLHWQGQSTELKRLGIPEGRARCDGGLLWHHAVPNVFRDAFVLVSDDLELSHARYSEAG
jgi:hypothetical protein